MKRISRIWLWGLAACLVYTNEGIAENSNSEARRGTRLYEGGEYDEAAKAFDRARALAREKNKHDPALDYNLGTSYAKAGKIDEAKEALAEVENSSPVSIDPTLMEDSLYNMAVTKVRIAERMREEGVSPQLEFATLQEAEAAFRRSLILDPKDEFARHNYAVTRKRLDELAEQLPPSPKGESSGDNSQEGDGDGSGKGSSKGSGDTPGSGNDKTSDESEGPSPSGSLENQDESSKQQQQEGGLEASVSPTPTPGPPSDLSRPEEGPKTDPWGDKNSNATSAPGGMDHEPEPTQKELDALRVLNSLEEGSPEQFKQLFRFRGGETKNLERDW